MRREDSVWDMYERWSRQRPNRSHCPSLLTFTNGLPEWLDLGNLYDVPSPNLGRVELKGIDIPDSFTLWINVLNLSDEPQNLGHRMAGLKSPETTSLIPPIFYNLSDVVVITGESFEEAVDQYLSWLLNCESISKEKQYRLKVKPFMLIVARNNGNKTAIEDVWRNNSRRLTLKRIKRLTRRLFKGPYCFLPGNPTNTEVLTKINLNRGLREQHLNLWSPRTFFELRAKLFETMTLCNKPPNIVKLLSAAKIIEEASKDLWPELISIASRSDNLLTTFLLPVMGSCFAWNALRLDHGKPYEITCELLVTCVVFRFDDIFENVYEEACKRIFPDDPSSVISLKDHMESSMASHEEDPNHSHFCKITRFWRYWEGVFSRKLCFGCLLYSCRIFLPCGHALCDTCFRSYTNNKPLNENLLTQNGPLKCKSCPFCRKSFPDFSITLSPPTSNARVLALDGGGTLGLVTLKLLEHLYKEIDLDLPFFELFDGIWGTSIGNGDPSYVSSSSLIFSRRHFGNPDREKEVDLGRVH